MSSPAPLAGSGAAENTYFLIFGNKGTGKTTMLRRLYAARLAAGGSATFIDRTGRNGGLTALEPAGAVVHSPAAWYAHIRAALAAGAVFNCVVQPKRGIPLAPLWALMHEVGNQLIAIDEAETWASSRHIDAELQELIALGRNQRIDVAATVRVPPELNRRIRSAADVVVSFRQGSAFYAEELNREHFHLPRGAELLQSLPPFHYIRAEHGAVTRGRIQP